MIDQREFLWKLSIVRISEVFSAWFTSVVRKLQSASKV